MLSSTTSISERFNINNLCTEDKQKITDSFNTYFTKIGVTLANKIKKNLEQKLLNHTWTNHQKQTSILLL